MTDFLIIDCPSAYNVVMGRPVMNDLNLVILIKALAIKFPTPNGTGCMKGEQYSVRRCYEEVLKMDSKKRKSILSQEVAPQGVSEKRISHDLDPYEVDYNQTASPVGELEDVIVSDTDAKKCLKLGKDLVHEVKTQLTDFLKQT